ncbi:hypothetical protein GCM10009077_31330 [Roseibium denhamense]|uniref:Uncharacterized protein n=1 Tax=Roseibium denhamense TaxID=76305 RepID=A0ABY1NU69_9HYPH|nr:hypothetical protein SAMN06265374_1903 [Roseibium denhamense]
MFHTGDQYEVRARAERHLELRRLMQCFIAFFKAIPNSRHRDTTKTSCHGEGTDRTAPSNS